MTQELLEYIFSKNEYQEKKISAFLKNSEIRRELDVFLETYSKFMQAADISYQDLGDAYLQMVDDMFAARLEFTRNGGVYPRSLETEAATEVYQRPEVMTKYMLGLALSQFLWAQHYALFTFYRTMLTKLNLNRQGNFLEVGSGHGLFLLELLKKISKGAAIDIVDISDTSIEISKKIVNALRPDSLNEIHFINSDVKYFETPRKYDFITMGEVLEHVNDPASMLRSVHEKLSDAGSAYISTCTDSPAIDHVYHFKTIQEIRDMIMACGFVITDEVIAPSENMPMEKIIKNKLDILYGAIIKKENK